MPSPAGSPSAVTTAIRKLQGQVTTLEKEIAVLKAEVEAQDKRIADGIGLHGAKVGLLANQTGMLTILIALVVLVSGFLGYWKAGEIAKDQAREWIKDNEVELRAEIDSLKSQANQAMSEINTQKISVEVHADSINRTLEQVKTSVIDGGSLSEKPRQLLQHRLDELSKKPRSQWGADDFCLEGEVSHANKSYLAASEAFSSAIKILMTYANYYLL